MITYTSSIAHKIMIDDTELHESRRRTVYLAIKKWDGSLPPSRRDLVEVLLVNGYIEHTDKGPLFRKPGSILFRRAKFAHRVEVINPAVSLVITGGRAREWGFFSKSGWIPWFEFLKSKREDC